MSKFLRTPSLTKFDKALIKVSDQLTRTGVSKELLCASIKQMFDQVPEWTFIEITVGPPPGKTGKPYPVMIKALNPEAEQIIKMGLDADCDWAKQKAAQHGIS
ncbi:MAG: hypothetical protein HWN65_08900 [Candidatus Helarchaeota archaeon]|nr:hypothetical protein [Candidatus Helarchaeota archaeon]